MTDKLLDYFNGDSLAASVWLGKYAAEGEETPSDTHRRMAKEFYRVDKKYQEKEGEEKRLLSEYGSKRESLTEEAIYHLFKDFKYVVPQGSIMSGLGTNIPVSYSNCVVVDSVLDSYGGIMYTDTQLVQLFKRRCGVGFDISNLRPNNSTVKNSAKTSTGVVSFMDRFSNSTREVAQDGRRGALMITIDIRHPDSLEFIKVKQDLTKVTGANISVRLNDEFMNAVENDEDYILRFPCDIKFPLTHTCVVEPWGKVTTLLNLRLDLDYNKLERITDIDNYNEVYVKKVKAKELWNELVKSAHNTAEPGILFWDNMINYSPDGVYDEYRAISTNP